MSDRGAPRDRARVRETGGPGKAAARSGGPRAKGLATSEIAALLLALVWLGLSLWWLLTLDGGQAGARGNGAMGLAWTISGVVLPVALIGVAVGLARTARRLRDDVARLDAALDALRRASVDQRLAASASRRTVEDRIGEVDRAQAELSAELAAIRMRPPGASVRKIRRAAGSSSGPEPLPPVDFIRAFDFPRDEDDAEGFRVLRAALEDPATTPLVTAAQDLMTLLAQDGILMDDLTVHAADAVLWRALADGVEGSDVAALGGIRDRSSLALAGGRMRDDAAFREAVQHFLQTFSQVFAAFAHRATDDEIMRFADTRTARAFMLTARIAGRFA